MAAAVQRCVPGCCLRAMRGCQCTQGGCAHTHRLPPPPHAVVFHRKPTGQEYPAWEGAGWFSLLPLSTRALANGGRVAEKAVVERVMEALAPLRHDAGAAPSPAQVGAGWGVGGTRWGGWWVGCMSVAPVLVAWSDVKLPATSSTHS